MRLIKILVDLDDEHSPQLLLLRIHTESIPGGFALLKQVFQTQLSHEDTILFRARIFALLANSSYSASDMPPQSLKSILSSFDSL